MTQISKILEAGPSYSYEFFPPKDAVQAAALEVTIGELATSNPDFISITYGALGSTRETTKDLVIAQNNRWSFPTMAHLTCVGQSYTELTELVNEYSQNGIENILALRGDGEATGELEYAVDLVNLIKDQHPSINVGVAAHPEIHPDSPSRELDRERLALKLEVADFAITQFFFDANDYYRMVDELAMLGATKPVIPGVMLFASSAGLERMSAMNKTVLPKSLRNALSTLTKPEDISKLAVETAAQVVSDLRDHQAPGVHIYTLNRSNPALELKKIL